MNPFSRLSRLRPEWVYTGPELDFGYANSGLVKSSLVLHISKYDMQHCLTYIYIPYTLGKRDNILLFIPQIVKFGNFR